MGWFSQKNIEYQNLDISYPEERAMIKMRLFELTERYNEIRVHFSVDHPEKYFLDSELKNILPEHLSDISNVERALGLARYELMVIYHEFYSVPTKHEDDAIQTDGQKEMRFQNGMAVFDAA